VRERASESGSTYHKIIGLLFGFGGSTVRSGRIPRRETLDLVASGKDLQRHFVALLLVERLDIHEPELEELDGLEVVRRLLVLLNVRNDLRHQLTLKEVDQLAVHVRVTVLDEGQIGKVHAQVRDARQLDAAKMSAECLVVLFARAQGLQCLEELKVFRRQHLTIIHARAQAPSKKANHIAKRRTCTHMGGSKQTYGPMLLETEDRRIVQTGKNGHRGIVVIQRSAFLKCVRERERERERICRWSWAS